MTIGGRDANRRLKGVTPRAMKPPARPIRFMRDFSAGRPDEPWIADITLAAARRGSA